MVYDDIFIYVPYTNQIIQIMEGTGDNLLDEDVEEGYVDYIYYNVYELTEDIPEVDGGQIMRRELIQDEFNSMEDCVPYVLDFVYQNSDIDYILLKGGVEINGL